MSVCINCGKVFKGCLCDDCRAKTDTEELCDKILEYKCGDNALWDEIAKSMHNISNFKYYVFELAGSLPSPKREYYRVLSIEKSGSIPKSSRKWLYEVYDDIKGEPIGKELNVIRGHVLNALFMDRRYDEAEKLASEILDCRELPTSTYLALADFYNKTRRYDVSEYIISQFEKDIKDDDTAKRLDELKESLERYKSGKEYMPKGTEIRQMYIDFLASVGIKAELPKKAEPEPIPREEYPMPFEVRDICFSDYTAFALTPTGRDTIRDCVVELAAVKVRNGKTADVFSTLVKPYKVSYNKVLSVIDDVTEDDLRNAKNMWDVFPEFMKFIEDDVLVGFDAANEVKYLVRMGRYSHIFINNKIFDIKHFSETNSFLADENLEYKTNVGAKDKAAAVVSAFEKIGGNDMKQGIGAMLDDMDDW